MSADGKQFLSNLRARLADRLMDIEDDFFRGECEYKLTLIARTEALPDGNIVISNDDFAKAATALTSLANRPETEVSHE